MNVLRRLPPSSIVLVLLALTQLVPLWIVDFLPFMDLPQHLATISVLHHHGDEFFGFAAFFDIDLSATPYLGYYLVTDFFANFMSVETASRVFLSLYALLLPLAAWDYLRAFGREPALALLALPLVYNTFLFMGFINFVAAIPFMLLGLAALRRYIDRGRWSTLAWLSFVTLAVYFMHTQVFLLYLGAAGLYVLMDWPGWKRLGLLFVHLVPTLVLLLIWIVSSGVLASGEGWSAARRGRNASPPGASWEELSRSLREMPGRLLDAYRDSSDDMIVLCFGLLFVALLFLRRAPKTHGARAWAREHALELITLVLIGLYFALPVTYKWVWPLNWRLVPIAVIVGLGTLRIAPLKGWWRQGLLIVPLAALSIGSTVVHTRHFERFQEEVGSFEEVLETIEPRRRTMGLIFDKGSGVMSPTLAPFIHFAQYAQVRRGGVADFSFANFAQSPVRFHDRTGPPILPLRWEWTPEKMHYPREPKGVADYYDYYLVRSQKGRRRPFGRYLGSEIREVTRTGRWQLYERVRTAQ